MNAALSILVLLLGFLAGTLAVPGGGARAEGDIFKALTLGTPIDTVRRYYNLIGPTDIGGSANVYVVPDAPFADLYGQLIFKFHGGRLERFRIFLGDKDSGDRFRSALRVMSGAAAWTQIFLRSGSVDIPLLVKPVVDPFKPAPAPPTSFSEGKSVWIECPISDEALFIYKQKRSYREFLKVVIGRNESLRGAVVSLHQGFVTVSFVPARDLIGEMEQGGEDGLVSLQPQGQENKDLDMLKPVAPR